MLKIVTAMFVLQQSKMYQEQLKTFEFKQAQVSVDQFVKWVYFERHSADFEPVEIKDLIDAADRGLGQSDGLGLMDLLRNLQGDEGDTLTSLMNALQ